MTESFHDPHGAPVSPFFERMSRVVLRFRVPLLIATLAVTGLFAYAARTHMRVDTSIEAFLAQDSEAMVLLEQLRDDFGRDEIFLVLVEGDVFSMPYLKRLKALHDELAAIDVPIASLGERKSERERSRRPGKHALDDEAATAGGGAESAAAPGLTDDDFADFGDDEGWGEERGGTVVDEIVSLVNARETRWKNGGLWVGGLLDDWPQASELPALRAHALKEPSLVGRVVSPEGHHSAISLRTQFMNEEDSKAVYYEVLRIAKKHEAKGFHIQVAGLAALEAAIQDLMMGDLARMAGFAIGLMILFMAVMFRHPLGVIGPILVVAQAVVWTFGTMALLDVPMTMISNILPAFVICVGIGDSVHIQSVYRDAMRRGASSHAAVVHAMATTSVPVVFTTLTTAVGLLSFRLAAVDAIREMGTFGALGVTLALLHTLVFLPIVLSFNRKSLLGVRPPDEQREDFIDRFLAFCNGLSMRRRGRRRVLGAAVVAGVVSVAGASMLGVYHNPLAWIPNGYAIKDAFDAVDTHMGGTADVTLVIEALPGKNLKDRELMQALDRLEEHIQAYRHPTQGSVVGNIVNVVDVVRETNRAVHEADQAHYAVPDTQRGVVDLMTLFENAGPDELRRLATIDMRRSIMLVRVQWMDASSFGPLVDHIEAGVDKYVGGLAKVSATGSGLNLLTVVAGLLSDLIKSFSTAFLVITVIMVVLLRDLKLGLISMVPNLLPIAAVIGVMGLSGIPIDLNNILLGSIAIGIAVDDTIHFLHQFRAHHDAHEDVNAAIDHAFGHAGRAMVTTSIILVSGFGVFLSAHMYNLQRFGSLVALTLVLALLVDLIFSPAMLRSVYGERGHKPDSLSGEHDVRTNQAAQ